MLDSIYDDVKKFVKSDDFKEQRLGMMLASVQRRFRIGYVRALCLLKLLADDGVIQDNGITKEFDVNVSNHQ